MERTGWIMICLVWLLSQAQLIAQPADIEAGPLYRVEWIGQVPSVYQNNRSVRNLLDRLILGKQPDWMVKPVSSAMDEQHMWILCQGNGKVYNYNDRKTIEISSTEFSSFPSLVSICSLPGKGTLFTDSFLEKVFYISEGSDHAKEFSDSTLLQRPTGIAYSPLKDQVWVVETGAHRISIFDANGNFIRTIGKRGSGPGEFNFPTHLTIDREGNVYVVDAMNYRIQVFDQEGNWISLFGKQGATSGSMARPKGIAVDSRGFIYVADALFHSIQIFSKTGEFLYYFGSQGGEQEQFWMPSGLNIDERDQLYVADNYNNRIQIFRLVTDD